MLLDGLLNTGKLGCSKQSVVEGAPPHLFGHQSFVDEAAMSMLCFLMILAVFFRSELSLCIGVSQFNCDDSGDLDRDLTSIS